MIAGPLLLTLTFVLLGVLLLSLNLRSGWRWPVKAAAIVTTGLFVVAFFIGLGALLGWPTSRALPEHFTLHASLVREPSKAAGDPGAIYLWLSPIGEESAEPRPPRAHRLPYSRELHERLARAEAKRAGGRSIEGRRTEADRTASTTSQQIELFEAPPLALPPKTVG
ncbi:MAG: hypothetical protein R3349_09980 [Geminicoccaceae bacterium]|nr:hypothetical protein [Geminicoccaceae bacterium]